jgi:cytochrome c
MTVNVLLVTLLGTAAVGAVVERSAVSAQQTSTAAPVDQTQLRTQWDGVFTEEQARRGEPLYTKFCANCHGAELKGNDKSPAVIGDSFGAKWNDLKLGALSERMRMTMPVDNPASLTRQQNADVLAFMLHKAGASAGETDLPTNVDRLNSIKFVAKQPAGPK